MSLNSVVVTLLTKPHTQIRAPIVNFVRSPYEGLIGTVNAADIQQLLRIE